MHYIRFYYFLIISCLFLIQCKHCKTSQVQSSKNEFNTDIAPEVDNRLLILATLDGTLVAVHQQTGMIQWKIKDKPIVRVPLDTSDAIVPIFLPDPRDGSLYLIGNSREPLKKLPFSIPELVASSPCRSSDGILYTGKKKDTWYKLDPETGRKEPILSWDVQSPTCSLIQSKKFVFIGRTKYSIMMVDSHNPFRKWNVTFYDYTSGSLTREESNNYNLVHFASTSSGRIITMDRRSGMMLWDSDFKSPIVGVYLLDDEGLVKVPFTSLANHTISYLAQELVGGIMKSTAHMKLYPTLYVGEHLYGLYAIPSLVDQNVVAITASEDGPLLLTGPHAPDPPRAYTEYPLPGNNYRLPPNVLNDDAINLQSLPSFGNHIVIYKGHYNVPDYTNSQFLVSGSSKKPLDMITHQSSSTEKVQTIKGQTVEPPLADSINHVTEVPKINIKGAYGLMKQWFNQQENKGLKLMLIILIGCIIFMYLHLQMQYSRFQNMSTNGSKSSSTSIPSSSSRHGTITATAEELPDGLVRVGKITFHPEQLLGKGCEGTFVYRGEFDSRRVAVKRLLPECFTFADREVALLRESDAHPHVIRYYCMEQDRMFRYIALELCQATLSEYIQGKCDTRSIKPLEILRQATAGLAHLHSLDIVHRDIKPHNVLLSVPSSKGEVRAMISDFGLCKKLQVGRMSFSRRSGVTGTEGWIAPEMLDGNGRMTHAIDLFSLGCLYYYVLSSGEHPFGDSLRRQANILNGESHLNGLKAEPWLLNLYIPLIKSLISPNPDERPPCTAVLAHPMFWDSDKILSFFQDVSDRVEKAELGDFVLKTLECNGYPIVQQDWRVHIHEEVAKDLRKYRSYRGESVRDLLRALRNKKHHFRELTKEAQDHLGEIPDHFTNYWTSRFPLLLVHSWLAMQCVAKEKTFENYYHSTHRYSLEKFRTQVDEFLIKNPIVLPPITTEVNVEHFNRKKPTEYYNRSPKRSWRDRPGEQLRRRDVATVTTNNSGLYRNVSFAAIAAGSTKPDPQDNTTEPIIKEIHPNSTQEEQFLPVPSRKSSKNHQIRQKKTRTVQEPLVWELPEVND